MGKSIPFMGKFIPYKARVRDASGNLVIKEIEGSYNKIYINEEQKLILKVQKLLNNSTDAYDTPKRSVELYNLLNPDPKFKAVEYDDPEHGKGWVCPFVEGTQASDQEISDKLIDIFNKTGRIVIDATARRNFLKTNEDQIVCVDVGMALEMERKEEARYESGITRKRSEISLEAWFHNKESFNSNFFKESSKTYPKSTNLIKAMIFIKSHRPDILNVNFLKDDQEFVNKLAEAYDKRAENPKADVMMTLKLLKEKYAPIRLQGIKASCIEELKRYIASRGTVDTTGAFTPGGITARFRNNMTTGRKVAAANGLIKTIEQAKSFKDIQEAISTLRQDKEITSGIIFTGLKTSLGKCSEMVKVAQREYPEAQSRNVSTVTKNM